MPMRSPRCSAQSSPYSGQRPLLVLLSLFSHCEMDGWPTRVDQRNHLEFERDAVIELPSFQSTMRLSGSSGGRIKPDWYGLLGLQFFIFFIQ